MLTITSLSHNPTCYTSFKLKQCLFHTLVCIFETKISRMKKATKRFKLLGTGHELTQNLLINQLIYLFIYPFIYSFIHLFIYLSMFWQHHLILPGSRFQIREPPTGIRQKSAILYRPVLPELVSNVIIIQLQRGTHNRNQGDSIPIQLDIDGSVGCEGWSHPVQCAGGLKHHFGPSPSLILDASAVPHNIHLMFTQKFNNVIELRVLVLQEGDTNSPPFRVRGGGDLRHHS